MIPVEEALRIVLENVEPAGTERVDITVASGRVLAEDVVSDVDMPPFRKSAMDGYACRRAEIGGSLKVVETIAAGKTPSRDIGAGECSKIMTGAMVPESANCVFMVEEARVTDGSTVRFAGFETKDNICAQGEDVRKGDVVLKKGMKIGPARLAVLAAVGCAEPLVYKQVKVGIIATGDELVEPREVPGPGQIRNSNACQLCAEVATSGGVPVYYGIARDAEAELSGKIRAAMAECRIVLISGGVSAGDFDLVPDTLKECGFKMLFEQIAIKPGKPAVFGVCGACACFGVPGNPVSGLVVFELLIRPYMWALMGHRLKPATSRMRLGRAVSVKRMNRASWIPVVETAPGVVEETEFHGSADLRAIGGSDGMICIPAGVEELAEGTMVDVRQV